MPISIEKASKRGVIVAVAAAGALSLAPAASADVVTFTHASCTTGTNTYAAYLSVHLAHSYTPLFVTDPATGDRVGVLVPQTIYLNGTLIGSVAPGLDTSNVTLSTCTFTSSRGTFQITGVLAPPTK